MCFRLRVPTLMERFLRRANQSGDGGGLEAASDDGGDGAVGPLCHVRGQVVFGGAGRSHLVRCRRRAMLRLAGRSQASQALAFSAPCPCRPKPAARLSRAPPNSGRGDTPDRFSRAVRTRQIHLVLSLACFRLFLINKMAPGRVQVLLNAPWDWADLTGVKMNGDDKELLWRYRYALVKEPKALTKCLICVDWSAQHEVCYFLLLSPVETPLNAVPALRAVML